MSIVQGSYDIFELPAQSGVQRVQNCLDHKNPGHAFGVKK